eukprot:6379055-Ditylum_brightwellii.AAC.1
MPPPYPMQGQPSFWNNTTPSISSTGTARQASIPVMNLPFLPYTYPAYPPSFRLNSKDSSHGGIPYDALSEMQSVTGNDNSM